MNYTQLNKRIISYRRDLHRIPELSFDLPKTSTYVKSHLADLSCQVSNIAGSGIIAYFDFGKKESICFRGDMDALPIQEVNDCEYASTHYGRMHACGHDAHTAGLLGFAEIVDSLKAEGFDPEYNAVLLFQPAEETIDGALAICQTDFFQEYNIKAIFGVHNWPTLPKGQISSIPGPMMAISASIDVEFNGISAHCGEYWKGKDALLAATEFIERIYAFNDNEIEEERSIIRFGRMESGNVRNAISSKTVLQGTIRAYLQSTWKSLVDQMEVIKEDIYKKTGVSAKVDVIKYHPAVKNDPVLYQKILPLITELGYKELDEPVMIAEDFSFFQEQVPGIFFFLGTGSNIPLHSNNYDMDDSVIIRMSQLYESIFKSLKDM